MSGPASFAYADFHIHTRFSRDSRLSEDRLIRLAIQRGLTHLVVTNHNNVEGAVAAQRRARELGVVDRLRIFVGEEVSTADGEVVGLFLSRTIPRGLSADETADEIHAQGGLVSIPHPFDPFRNSHIREAPLLRLAKAGKIDCVEVFNCRVALGRYNQAAAEFAARYDLPGIASSDTHSGYEVGMATNAMPPFSTADELRAGLRLNEWHATRSTVFIHMTTRYAVYRNVVDRWLGRRSAAGPILGPETPQAVRTEPVERPAPSELPPAAPPAGLAEPEKVREAAAKTELPDA
ncbi:MAG TPA: PHP domain-containing protein [Candidatus Limnocylindria bacterium]|nr:PHP domain-containing protein [Candidatus Limnocylindria bacterium]